MFSHIRSFFIDFPVRESYTVDMRIISVESISEAVKTRRKQLGLTQSETAAMCNVGARFFSELENGKETLQMNKVLHCLEMLGINLYAVNREDDK
jgi:y4mF family transcriptional regulator